LTQKLLSTETSAMQCAGHFFSHFLHSVQLRSIFIPMKEILFSSEYNVPDGHIVAQNQRGLIIEETAVKNANDKAKTKEKPAASSEFEACAREPFAKYDAGMPNQLSTLAKLLKWSNHPQSAETEKAAEKKHIYIMNILIY